MKSLKTFSLLLILVFFKLSANAQKLTRDYNIGKIFYAYLDIKNALVDNEGTKAEIKANELYTLLASEPAKGLNPEQSKLIATYLEALLINSRHMAKTTFVDEQRPYFAKLSAALFELLKGLKINTTTIYQQYCSTNNLYWLSESPTIANPYYYSKEMVSDGKITAKLLPVK